MKSLESKRLAKEVFVEILRQADGWIVGKTRLFKAFYLAHLYYFRQNSGLLTDWPIVHMPFGPGVEAGQELINELVASGAVRVRHESDGPFPEIEFRLAQPTPSGLAAAAQEAIRSAVRFVSDKSATELSNLLHERSRAWNSARPGEPLNIYTDMIPEEQFDSEQARLTEIREELAAVFRGD